jgi:hypothetical protein
LLFGTCNLKDFGHVRDSEIIANRRVHAEYHELTVPTLRFQQRFVQDGNPGGFNEAC